MGPELMREFNGRLTATPPEQLPILLRDWAAQWMTPARWTRMLQLYKQWEEKDFEGYYINPTKRHVRPFWPLPKAAAEQALVLAAAGTPGDTVPHVQYQVDTQGHYEIAYTMFAATSPNFLVQIFDGGNVNKSLMNREVHARTIAGSARRPLIWPETYFLNVEDAPRTISVSFRNLSALSNTVRWAFHGRRWYHKEAPPNVQEAIFKKFERMEKTYTYFLTLSLPESQYGPSTPEGANPPAITLAAGQTLQENSAPIFWATDEADTEVFKTTVFASQGPGSFEFQLREAQSGRTLSNGFVSDVNGWGDGEFPFVLPETFLMERNYKVLFEVRNLSGAENRIFPTLIGRRLQYA